jgi:beta-carotene 3-hydroxylase
VSYATHRWVMHGPGMPWHRSHHLPPKGRFERNDLFPLTFSMLGVTLFALGATSVALSPASWVGVGVTSYGAAYLFVHEICIHRRLSIPVGRSRYVGWLRASHGLHHRFGGEPYGMLFPVVSGALRTRGRTETGELDRSPRS